MAGSYAQITSLGDINGGIIVVSVPLKRHTFERSHINYNSSSIFYLKFSELLTLNSLHSSSSQASDSEISHVRFTINELKHSVYDENESKLKIEKFRLPKAPLYLIKRPKSR